MSLPAYWLFLLLATFPGGVQPPADMPRDLIVTVRPLPAGIDAYACVGVAVPGYCAKNEIAVSDRIWSDKRHVAQHIIAHEVGHFLYQTDGEYGAEAYACRVTGLYVSTYNMTCEGGTLKVGIR